VRVTATVPAASASVEPVATSSVPESPSAQAEAAGITSTITAEDGTTVRLGGPPMRFTVALVNNGPDVPGVGLVVSLGHCSCGPPGASMMAQGTMRRLDPQTNQWVDAPYVRQGTGMDFILGNLVPPFPLAHGQTVSYELEVALNAEQSFEVTNGDGGIEVTLADPDDPMEGDRLGKGSFLPITVET
jgi:hypothetical protein